MNRHGGFLEELMIERFLGRNAFFWAQSQQASGQIQATAFLFLVVGHVCEHFSQVTVRMLLEFDLFNQREIAIARPDALRRRAQVPEDGVQLIGLTFTAEDRLQVQKFSEYAADGPHIDRATVLFRLQQQFGRPVPESHNDRRVRFQGRSIFSSLCDNVD